MEAELLNQHSMFLLCGTASPRVPRGSGSLASLTNAEMPVLAGSRGHHKCV